MEDIQILVDRRTFIIKVGKMDEAVALVKAEEARIREAQNYTGATRHCISYIGPFDHYVVEMEWNSLAEWEAFWVDWQASPEAAAFLEKWWLLTDQGGGVKIWQLVE